LKVAVAALAMLVPAGLAVHFGMKASEERSAREIAERNAAALVRERDALATEKRELAGARDAVNVSYDAAKKKIEELSAESTKQKADLAALNAIKDQLDQEVKLLTERQLYADAKIALLSPSPQSKAAKAIAVSLWNQKEQKGVFVVRNLPPLKADRNYQLWVLDGGKVPVSAGLLILDGNGGGRIEFKAKKQVADPAVFAVTNEVKGEQIGPDVTKMVLLGN
jgi:hypothetical protein